MKENLLTIVQGILSGMSSDKINTLGETEEANQVAALVKDTYYDLIARKDWPHLRQAGQLTNSADINKPTHMAIPEDASRIDYIAYSQQTQVTDNIIYRRVEYMHPDSFLEYTSRRSTSNPNVEVINQGAVFYVLNDTPPTYYTSFDDVELVFDSYVVALGNTLTAVNSQVVYYRMPSWTAEDTFIPDLPAEAFPLFKAEAKSVCFNDLKQEPNAKAEQISVRQNQIMGQRNWAVKGGVRYPNYGRQSKKLVGGRNFNPSQHTG